LLTVETEANVDSQSTKRVLLWLACWARRAGTKDFCPAFCCSSRPSTKYCFPRPILFPERLERGGPLLAVETEVNGDSKSTNERGPWLVRCGYLIAPISQQAGQAVVPRRCLLISVSGKNSSHERRCDNVYVVLQNCYLEISSRATLSTSLNPRSQKGSRVSIVHSCVSFGIS
jgi:hypothetical protein